MGVNKVSSRDPVNSSMKGCKNVSAAAVVTKDTHTHRVRRRERER